jgi:hypothetical protein
MDELLFTQLKEKYLDMFYPHKFEDRNFHGKIYSQYSLFNKQEENYETNRILKKLIIENIINHLTNRYDEYDTIMRSNYKSKVLNKLNYMHYNISFIDSISVSLRINRVRTEAKPNELELIYIKIFEKSYRNDAFSNDNKLFYISIIKDNELDSFKENETSNINKIISSLKNFETYIEQGLKQ